MHYVLFHNVQWKNPWWPLHAKAQGDGTFEKCQVGDGRWAMHGMAQKEKVWFNGFRGVARKVLRWIRFLRSICKGLPKKRWRCDSLEGCVFGIDDVDAIMCYPIVFWIYPWYIPQLGTLHSMLQSTKPKWLQGHRTPPNACSAADREFPG